MPLCTVPDVRDVGVVGALRVADRDEVHVLARRARRSSRVCSVHGPCSVWTTGGRAAEHRAADRARRCRRGRGRRRTRRPEVRRRARGTRRTRGCRARAGRAAPRIGETSVGLGARPAAREQRDVVAGVDETVGEQRHDELDPAVAGRRDREPHRGDDCDPHRARRLMPDAVGGPCTAGRRQPVACLAMPEPWTTSASATHRRPTAIVTLVEGSAFCISSRSGEIDPGSPAGPVLPRHALPLRAAAAAERACARAARRDHARSVQRACSCCAATRRRATPTRTSWCSAPLRRARHARRHRDRELRRGSRVLLGRARWSAPTSPTCSRSRRAGSRSRASSTCDATGTPHHVHVQARRVRPRRRTSTSPATPRIAGNARRRTRSIVPPRGELVGVHPGHAGDRRPGDHAPLPVRPAGRAVDAGRAARGVAAPPAGGHERRRPVPRAARPLDRGPRRAAHLRPRVSRPRGRRRGRAVVHDAVRPRLAAHVVDDDARRSRPRARHARRRSRASRAARSNPRTEEEPGRILHEMRFGETASLALGGGRVYYGTVDATPLFVMLLGELSRWGNRREEVDALLPGRRPRARSGSTSYGDRDGDGYVEYQRTTDRGLQNQGWKDSLGLDALRRRHARGDADRAVRGAGLRVRGARSPASHCATEAGDHALAATLRRARAELEAPLQRGLLGRGRRRLLRDGPRPRQAAASTASASNMGHCLWTGIVDEEKAPLVARAPRRPTAMFSRLGRPHAVDVDDRATTRSRTTAAACGRTTTRSAPRA